MLLFAVLARAVECGMGVLNLQGLSNAAWAFGTTSVVAPALLDPISVLDAMDTPITIIPTAIFPSLMFYQMLMHALATTG